jgi:RNA 2',3'-cyclic 3'-phosphodiesterase
MTRAFFAINLEDNVRRQLIQEIDLKAYFPHGIRWVKEYQLHLTLRFLGDISTMQLDRIIHSPNRLRNQPTFNLELQGIIMFPPARPRIIAVSTRLTDELSRLVQSLEHDLNRLGFKAEKRPFLPHITLGRVTKPLLHLPNLPLFNVPILQKVSKVDLVKSQPSAEGRQYTTLHQFALNSYDS